MGNTPLHVACYNGQDVVIEELINNGANVNAANRNGLVSTIITIYFTFTPLVTTGPSTIDTWSSENVIKRVRRLFLGPYYLMYAVMLLV